MQNKMLLGLIMSLFTLIFVGVYWIMEPTRQETASQRQQTEAIERGAELYSSTCAACHGSRGEGLVGPALKGTELEIRDLEKIIARGVAGTPMVAWSKEDNGPLHQQHINDLALFIKNWDGVPTDQETTPTPSSQTTPPAKDITSESLVIDAGEIFTGTCAVCHGQNREGTTGLAPPLTPETLAVLTDDQVGDVITNGRPNTLMVGFEEKFDPDVIAALVQYLKYSSP